MPLAIGLGLVIVATLGLIVVRRWMGWREKEPLFAWIVVPVVFFQVWPVKGFQYLLPISAPIAIVAAISVTEIFPATIWRRVSRDWIRTRLLPKICATAAVAASLAVGSWLPHPGIDLRRFPGGLGWRARRSGGRALGSATTSRKGRR